jgi:hypothetical protein
MERELPITLERTSLIVQMASPAKQGVRGPAHMHGSPQTGYRVTSDALAGAKLPETLFCQMISDEPDESLGSD